MMWLFDRWPFGTALALFAVVVLAGYDLAHGDLWAAVAAVWIACGWKIYQARKAYAVRESERLRVVAEQVAVETRADAARLGLPWPDDDRPYVVDLTKLRPESGPQ